VIKFLVGENVPSAEIHHRLQQQYGEECLRRRHTSPTLYKRCSVVVLWILCEITEHKDPVKEANTAQVNMLNYTAKCHSGVSARLATIIILTVRYFRFERTRTVSFPYAACRGREV